MVKICDWTFGENKPNIEQKIATVSTGRLMALRPRNDNRFYALLWL